MGRNRPSNEDAPRVPGEEGGRPWGKIVLGLILLLLLALLIPFACQALGGGPDGSKGSSEQGSSGNSAGDGSSGDGSSGDGSGKQAAGDREETSAASSDSQSGRDDKSGVRAEISPPSERSGDGGKITIPRAKISGANGWIAVHANDNGEPGDVLGHAPIQEGENTNVEVKLDRPVDSGKLYAMVHAEDPADGDYTFPDGDPPVDQSGSMVVKSFEYAVTSRATDASNGPSTSTSDGAPNDTNTTGGIDNKPLPDSGGFGPLALAGVILLATGSMMRRNLRT